MQEKNFIRPYKGACGIAVLGLVMAIVAIATPEWTKTAVVTIGLWTLTDSMDGKSYYWTSVGEYNGKFTYLKVIGPLLCSTNLGQLIQARNRKPKFNLKF